MNNVFPLDFNGSSELKSLLSNASSTGILHEARAALTVVLPSENKKTPDSVDAEFSVKAFLISENGSSNAIIKVLPRSFHTIFKACIANMSIASRKNIDSFIFDILVSWEGYSANSETPVFSVPVDFSELIVIFENASANFSRSKIIQFRSSINSVLAERTMPFTKNLRGWNAVARIGSAGSTLKIPPEKIQNPSDDFFFILPDKLIIDLDSVLLKALKKAK